MELQNVRLELIGVGENTRSKVDKKSIADLAQSIDKNGLLQPIGIRKDGKFEKPFEFELIYGFRRLEAFRLLKKETIPAVVYKTDDATSLQIIENLQREDITPLDLAKSIKRYKKESKLSFQEIGNILGKTITEVSQINQLNDLIKPMQDLLSKGILELDTALFVARYPESEQTDFYRRHKGEDRLIISEAKEFFSERNLKLKTVPWALDKAFKGLPKCKECPQRSSQQNVLFPLEENPDDTCLNSICMKQKIETYVKERIAEAKKLGEVVYLEKTRGYNYADFRYAPENVDIHEANNFTQAEKAEKDFVYGIIIRSDELSNIGQIHKYIKKKGERTSSRSSGKTRMEDLKPAEQNKRRIEIYKRKKDLILFPMSKDIALEISKQIKAFDFSKQKTMPVEALAVVAEYVRNHSNYETRNKINSLWSPGKDKLNLGKIYLMLITAATYYDLENNQVCEFYSRSEWFKRLKEVAVVLGIDLKKIEKEIRPKYDKQVNTLKERFIARNKIEPEKPIKTK